MLNISDITNNIANSLNSQDVEPAPTPQYSAEDSADFALTLSEFVPNLGDDVTVLPDRQIVAEQVVDLPSSTTSIEQVNTAPAQEIDAISVQNINTSPMRDITIANGQELNSAAMHKVDITTKQNISTKAVQNINAMAAQDTNNYPAQTHIQQHDDSILTSEDDRVDPLLVSMQPIPVEFHPTKPVQIAVNMGANTANLDLSQFTQNYEFDMEKFDLAQQSNSSIANQSQNDTVETTLEIPNAATDSDMATMQNANLVQNNLSTTTAKIHLANQDDIPATADFTEELSQQIMANVTEQSTHVTHTATNQHTQLNTPSDPAAIATNITVPVQDADWGDAMNQKIHWLTSQNVKSADIHLTPQELGPIRAKIQIQDGITTVTLHSEHAEVREALAQNLVSLNQLFHDNGLELPQVAIAGESQSDADMHSSSQYNSQSEQPKNQTSPDFQLAQAALESTVISDSLIDYYA